MHGILTLLAATTLGIDVGWEPLPDGGFEYIIQIEPQTLDSMRSGTPISSALPPAVSGMRGYRIVVGNQPLPHQGELPPSNPPPAAAPPTEIAPAAAPPAETVGAPSPGGADRATSALPASALAFPEFGSGDSAFGAEADAIPAPTATAPPDASAAGNETPPPALPRDLNASPITPHSAGFAGSGMTRISTMNGEIDPSGVQPATAGVAANGSTANQDDSVSINPSAKNESDSPGSLTPLLGAMLALCASVAANVFLGWNTVAVRSRYRDLLAHLPGR